MVQQVIAAIWPSFIPGHLPRFIAYTPDQVSDRHRGQSFFVRMNQGQAAANIAPSQIPLQLGAFLQTRPSCQCTVIIGKRDTVAPMSEQHCEELKKYKQIDLQIIDSVHEGWLKLESVRQWRDEMLQLKKKFSRLPENPGSLQ